MEKEEFINRMNKGIYEHRKEKVKNFFKSVYTIFWSIFVFHIKLLIEFIKHP